MPSAAAQNDANTMMGLRPTRSESTNPMIAPIGAPNAMTVVQTSDDVTLMPCLTKKVGSQLIKPYSENPMTTLMRIPIRVRGSTAGVNTTQIDGCLADAAAGTAGVGAAEDLGDATPARASISRTIASASCTRPFDSSQRGDSGRDRRSA